jgi:flagellar hook assembly protein FlgD
LIGARGLCTQIGIADETPAPEAERNRVTAQPNPFATRTTLVIDLVTPAEIELRITNALGRVVAEENLGSLHAGRHRWTWNGRDAGGRQAPAGVYYAEIQAGGRSLVTRLMVLR